MERGVKCDGSGVKSELWKVTSPARDAKGLFAAEFHPFIAQIREIQLQIFGFTFFRMLHFKSTQILLVKLYTIEDCAPEILPATRFAFPFHSCHPSLHLLST